jgi:hypothetical protein
MPLLCGLNGYICGLEDYHIMGFKIYGFVGELNDSYSFGMKLNINFTLLLVPCAASSVIVCVVFHVVQVRTVHTVSC